MRIILTFFLYQVLIIGCYGQLDLINDVQKMMKLPGVTYQDIVEEFESRFHQDSTYDEGCAENEYLRWKQFWENRVSFSTNTPEGNFTDYFESLEYHKSNFTPNINSQLSSAWNFEGPSNFDSQSMGRITAVALNPINQNTAFCGGNSGGLWKSTNFLSNKPTWFNVTDDYIAVHSLGINDIQIDPMDTNIIYIATGIYKSEIGQGLGGGLYKSTNGGNSWNQILVSQISEIIFKVAINPATNDIFALTESSIHKYNHQASTWTVVFPSAGGPSLSEKVNLREIQFIANTSFVFVSSDCAGADNNTQAILLKSSNNGDSFEVVSNIGSSQAVIYNIATTPALPNRLYLLYAKQTSSDMTKVMLYKTDNLGSTWELLSNDHPNTPGGVTEISGYGYWRNGLCVSPNDPLDIYVGAYHVNNSTDGGRSFKDDNSNSMHIDVRCLELIPTINQGYVILAGNDGGVAFSDSPGLTWLDKTGFGMAITQFFNIGTNSRGIIAGGTMDNSVMTKVNDHWSITYQGDASEVSFLPNNSTAFLAQSWSYGRRQLGYIDQLINDEYESPINPYSHISFIVPLVGNVANTGKISRPLEFDHNGAIYYCLKDLWKTDINHITNWQRIYNHENPQLPLTISEGINAMAIGNKNNDVVIYLSSDHSYGGNAPSTLANHLIVSQDGGLTWDDLSNIEFEIASLLSYNPFKYNRIESIACNPDSPLDVWVSISGPAIDNNPNYRVWRSVVSNGSIVKFINYSDGLPGVPFEDLVYHKGTNNGLYAATDAGVYYTSDDIYNQYGWIYLNENLPDIIITDVEIDECRGKLVASTYGRGVFSTDLVDNQYQDKHITINTTISDEVDYFSDLIIEAGITLTISNSGIVNMGCAKKIIVKPNARLIIDGGTITNLCGEHWEGIVVLGSRTENQNPSNHPTNQGLVHLYNGATISNANVGIRVGNSWASAGGVVKAYDAQFINNRNSISYMSYNNIVNTIHMPNEGHFQDCVFTVDDNYDDNERTKLFQNHVTLWQVEGIKFLQCKFSNEISNKKWRTDGPYNRAIFALSSNIDVIGTCPDPDIDGVISTSNYDFSGFDYAIELTGHNLSYSSIIHKSSFDDNVFGIQITGLPQVSIRRNLLKEFTCDVARLNPSFLYRVGLEVRECHGFEVEENYFNGQNSVDYDNIGISTINLNLNYRKFGNNEIYRNFTNNTNYAIQATGRNRVNDDFIGGRFLCNSFLGSTKRDIDITEDASLPSNLLQGVRGFQGFYDFAGDNKVAAANKFSLTQNVGFYNICNESMELTYLYNDLIYPGEFPSQITANSIALWGPGSGSNDVEVNTCPSHIENGINYPLDLQKETSLTTSFNAAKTAYWNLYYNYLQLIDGGSTPAILQEIQNTWPQQAWDLRNDLLVLSPFLSDEALIEAAISGILPDAILIEICLANPDATGTEEFLDILRNDIPNPLPEYMIELIRASWGMETPRSIIELGLATYGSEKDYTFNRLMGNMKYVGSAGKDYTAIRALHTNRNEMYDRYAIVDTYIAEEDFEAALDELAQIALDYTLEDQELEEHQNYVTYHGLLKALYNNSRTIYEFTPTEISQLEVIADDQTGSSSLKARNLLCFAYGLCDYTYPNPSTDSIPKSTQYFSESSEKILNDLLNDVEVSPNPAKEYTKFSWELRSLENATLLQIYDVSGKLVHQFSIKNQIGSYIWYTSNVENGNYVYRICDEELVLHNGKLTINK